jgi:ferredoxin
MKAEVDYTKCRGMGQCEMVASAIFEVGDDGQSHVLKEPSEDERADVQHAVDSCPTGAISIED